MATQSCAPVEPIAVIRTAVTLDFHVPRDARLTVNAQSQRAVRGREGGKFHFSPPVLARRRSPGVLRVTSSGPRPEPAQQLAVRLPAGLVTTNRGAVATPAADDRIERPEAVRLSGRLVLGDEFSHPAMVPVHRLRAGVDDSLATAPGRADGRLANMASQEVKAPCSSVAGERMDKARFTRFQFQPPTFEFRREDDLTLLYYLSVWVENH